MKPVSAAHRSAIRSHKKPPSRHSVFPTVQGRVRVRCEVPWPQLPPPPPRTLHSGRALHLGRVLARFGALCGALHLELARAQVGAPPGARHLVGVR